MTLLRILIYGGLFVLVVHGAVHLMGALVYLKLKELPNLPYKTALLAGRWQVGEAGMRLYAWFWVLGALGFFLAALALLLGWSWAPPFLTLVTLFSLALTLLDYDVAYLGLILNLFILLITWLGPRLAGWLA